MTLAYCGLICNDCPIHAATLETDKKRQLEMRVNIARLCRERYGMNYQTEDITDCDGCNAGGGRLFSGCGNCEIRKCALEKKVESCAYCNDYICAKLDSLLVQEPGSRARLDELKKLRR